MELLLREHTTTGALADRELSADRISVGAGNDQLIQLLGTDVRAQHASFSISGGSLKVQAVGGTVAVDGEAVRSAQLQSGSVVSVGGHELRVSDAPAGFDAAIELIPDANVDPSAFEAAFQTSLDETWLSKRGPAWTIAALVLLMGLLIPVYLIIDGDPETPATDATILTDAYWTSGPLHPVHNVAIGDDCGACHKVPFQKVPDDACTACHTNLADHIAPTHFAAQNSESERCAVCHVEHNEPEFLVVRADSLCVDCHADPAPLADGDGHMRAVTGFDLDNHPRFELALLTAQQRPVGSGITFDWGLQEVPLQGAVEASNLKFPHDLHLDPDSVLTVNEGRGMVCADCHTLSADDEHFEPVTMQAHCQECHELTFDEAAPQRQLPHGEPFEIIQVMEGHFARLFADPQSSVNRRAQRRVPDRSRQAGCSGTVIECATQRTEAEVTTQFAVRGCVTCHEVADTGNPDIYNRYQVHPVRLSQDFIPTAIFDHRSHLTQEDAQGDQACLTCHAANVSQVSTDILIPDIENCTQCHSDHRSSDTVPLDCIACHQYHPLEAQPISYLERNL